MSNASTVSKLVTMVKGIFGRKEKGGPAAAGPVSAEKPEKPEAPEQAAEPAAADGAAATAAATGDAAGDRSSTDDAKGEEAGRSEETAEAETEPAKADAAESDGSGADGATADTAGAEAAEKAETAQEEGGEPERLVEPEEREAVAEELSANADDTQVASDEVLEKVRKDSAPAAEDLPVPNYDEVTLPSVRARLRKLTIDEVRLLRAYEVAHQERPEFIKMYDNRIAKLQSEDQ
ncbi:hypothetical protein O4J56_10115 [Nocardiopsis sp. RSe5-2]|uniref:DUF8129 domain-containing protein n=1 Tax=Nocardiopsis endophytica TaxID=3018445 RepID=A0ABT4U236_9ACTN|nr:hypothetical protein [Nocardiopsis endophytica]MDA2810990.1 hypothetical protein [Nocardiopsis endophytica]